MGRPRSTPTRPAPDGFDGLSLAAAAGRWDAALGEYVLDWDDVRAAGDPRALAVEFARSAFRQACSLARSWPPPQPEHSLPSTEPRTIRAVPHDLASRRPIPNARPGLGVAPPKGHSQSNSSVYTCEAYIVIA